MGRWVDNRETEIYDLLWDGIDSILSEIIPILEEEDGAFDGASNYRITIRGRLHKKLHEEIWSNIVKHLDSVEQDINYCIEKEIDKAVAEVNENLNEMEKSYDSYIVTLGNRIAELEEENRLFREDKAGVVHGKQYGI